LANASSGDTIKDTVVIKCDAAEVIETSIPNKDYALCRDVNPIESPAAVGIGVAGRAKKDGLRLGSWQGYEREDECNRDPEQANAVFTHIGEDEFDCVRSGCRTKDTGSRQNKKKYPDEKMQAFAATILSS
jgi:hypothetical protein